MNKTDLIEVVAKVADLKKKDAEAAVSAVLDAVADALVKGEKVQLIGFGTFEVKGKGKQHFYGVVNMPQFNIEEFFRKTNPKFKVDPDCAKAIGPKGPKTLAEVRTILGIPTPDFGGVNLDAEESKIKAT